MRLFLLTGFLVLSAASFASGAVLFADNFNTANNAKTAIRPRRFVIGPPEASSGCCTYVIVLHWW